MSYADKRFKPECADPRCREVGTVLKTYGGRLDWYCSTHAEMIQPVSERRR